MFTASDTLNVNVTHTLISLLDETKKKWTEDYFKSNVERYDDSILLYVFMTLINNIHINVIYPHLSNIYYIIEFFY